jgi:hypothetical protein
MKYLVLIFLSINYCFGSIISKLPESKRYLYKKKQKSLKTSRKKIRKKESKKESKKELEYYKRLALLRISTPHVFDGGMVFKTGDMIRASLINNVLSTNLKTPIIVSNILSDKIDQDAKLICEGVTKHKRVQVHCFKLVTKFQEIKVNISLLNNDGTAGLTGLYYDGKDQYVAGILASEMAKGAMSVAQSKVNTNIGLTVEVSAKNQALQGLINTSNEVTELFKEQMKTNEPKVFIKSGKKVVLFFNQSINLNQQ